MHYFIFSWFALSKILSAWLHQSVLQQNEHQHTDISSSTKSHAFQDTTCNVNTHSFPIICQIKSLSASVETGIFMALSSLPCLSSLPWHNCYSGPWKVHLCGSYLCCWNQCLCIHLSRKIPLEDKGLFLIQLLKWALCFDCTGTSLSISEQGRLIEGHLQQECPRRNVSS